MAIRLASAIGEQRTPVDMLGGLNDAINKTGDAIQAGQERKAEAAAKKAEQDQKLKDLLASSLKVEPIEGHPNDVAEYNSFVENGLFNIKKAALDSNITPSQQQKIQEDFLYGVKARQKKYKTDFDTLHDISKSEDSFITQGINDYIMGKTNPTQVAEMQGDDFMAASEADRAGKMVGEGGMKATETKTLYQGKPYFELPFDERLKIDLKEKANELMTPINPGIVPAAQGYLGKTLDFGSYLKRTDKVNPTTGEYIFQFDEKSVDEDAKKFASSMLGKGNFGSKEHALAQKAYEREALIAGNEAGFSGQRLADFVEETVARRAYDDFVEAAQIAAQKRMMNDKEVTKAPSKGIDITFTSGGGGSSKIWNIGDAQEKPLYEVKDGKKTNKVIGDYYYHAIQTAAAGENPKKFNIAGNTDVQIEGINVNKKTGKPEYIDITIPAKYDSYGDKIPNTGIKKTVRITEDTEIENLRTNLGKNLYDKTIGAHKPMKEEKAAPNKEATKPKKVTKEEVKNNLSGF